MHTNMEMHYKDSDRAKARSDMKNNSLLFMPILIVAFGHKVGSMLPLLWHFKAFQAFLQYH